MSHRCLSPTYVEQPRAKLSYRERYESEHTYATNQGGRHFKERQAPSPPALAEEGSVIPASPQPETDLDYESDFEVDREPISKIAVEEIDVHEYDNDSFIIDDDGKEGDLTGSSPEVSAAEKSSKKQKTKVSMELEES